ncbi:MAG: DNA-directed RNA polymerase subunit beta', partial [Ignavibacteriaceae bacterium]|nr:DNA-directed RNA polymerase subunit beta' [Ignavibacteriaceae bacterium]
LQKIKVVQPGDTGFLEEDIVDKSEFMEENEKMMESVIVTDAGGSIFKPGQIISRKKLSELNLELKKRSKAEIQYRDAEQATFDHMLLGITRAALETESFISAASFQETTKVLANAAVQAKRDTLRGLKENVVMGRLIPAGTGLRKYRSLIVRDEDEMAFEEIEQETSKVTSV